MNRQMCVVMTVLLALGSVACFLPACSQAKAYRIAVVPWIGWSTCDVAQAKGYWRDLGVDVEIVRMESNIKMNEALRKGLVDLHFDMIGTAIGLYMKGVAVIVIGETDWSNGGDKIIEKKGTDLKKLKGRPVGVYLDEPSVTYFLNKYFLTHGLTVTDFKVTQEIPEEVTEMFIKNRFKLIQIYDPLAIKAVQEGNGEVVATTADYPGCMPEGLLMIKSAYEEMPKDNLQKIFQGSAKASAWCNDSKNWEEFRRILNERTFKGGKPYSETELRKMFGEAKIHTPAEMLERNKIGGGTEAFIKDVRAFLKANGRLKKNFSVKDVFNGSVLVEALRQ
jgi:NitT/TauT family transport system substrate-binding protein